MRQSTFNQRRQPACCNACGVGRALAKAQAKGLGPVLEALQRQGKVLSQSCLKLVGQRGALQDEHILIGGRVPGLLPPFVFEQPIVEFRVVVSLRPRIVSGFRVNG
jgi:hypothetical protein